LTFANGFGWQLAGAILDNGRLELDHVVVRNSTVTAGAGEWWMGGGGIYVGGGATLSLKDSTVRDNVTHNGIDGAGIYVFQNGTLSVERSTISGNVAANVGGGLRMLGSGAIRNSTFSGNATVAWQGSALFVTDGVLSVVNSTISGNTAPAGSAAVFVGTFTDASATLSLANTILAQNSDVGCFVAPWGAGLVTLVSGGHNVFADATCNPVASDLVVGDAGPAAGISGARQRRRGPVPGHRPARRGAPARDRLRRGGVRADPLAGPRAGQLEPIEGRSRSASEDGAQDERSQGRNDEQQASELQHGRADRAH
jgi:hypothetical protein